MREDIRFIANGVTLAGWYYPAPTPSPAPVIVLCHGFSAVMAMGLDAYARVFQRAGFACLAYDHRNFGESGGEPRYEIDPWQQVADLRDAISHVRTLPGVDAARVGLWGTSYAGGHVLTVAALDRRVRCVVSQVPLVNGYETLRTWIPESAWPRMQERFAEDRDARYRGAEPRVTSPAPEDSATWAWVVATSSEHCYPNRITQRSLELIGTYEPAQFVPRITPTPLLMVLATRDEQTPYAGQRAAWDTAGEPKRLVELDCTHYAPYTTHFEASATAARDWFLLHLST